MNKLNSINGLLVTLNSGDLVRTIFYGDKKNDNGSDFKTVAAIIKFIKRTQRVERPLF